jgi:4'-phosphopantetheinyl transferase EntD
VRSERAQVLVKMLHPARPRDGHDLIAPREDPGERQLGQVGRVVLPKSVARRIGSVDAVMVDDGRPRSLAAGATRRSWAWPRTALRATTGDDRPEAAHPEEQRLVEGASTVRRDELARGRACARAALLDIGVDARDLPLLPDARGAVRWPSGTTGSITHTTGWTGAVAARRAGWGGVSSIGLDAEAAHPLDDGVLEVVASAAERREVDRLGSGDPAVPWSVVLHGAKEAVYKAVYPLWGELLDHDDVRVRLHRNRFVGRATGRGSRHLRVRGRWWTEGGTLVALGVVRSVGAVRPLVPDLDPVRLETREVRGP